MDWLLIGLLISVFIAFGTIRLLAWYLTKRTGNRE